MSLAGHGRMLVASLAERPAILHLIPAFCQQKSWTAQARCCCGCRVTTDGGTVSMTGSLEDPGTGEASYLADSAAKAARRHSPAAAAQHDRHRKKHKRRRSEAQVLQSCSLVSACSPCASPLPGQHVLPAQMFLLATSAAALAGSTLVSQHTLN